MRYFFLWILILSYSANLFAAPKLLQQDAFIFRIMNDVISFNDMKRDYGYLLDLKCLYPESILIVIFEELKKDADTIKFEQLTPDKISYDKQQKDFFKKVINFYKLKAYTQTHQVMINPALITGFYAVGKRSKCNMDGFASSKKFKDHFAHIVKMEIFLRSRFLPDQKGPPDAARLTKIKGSANLFVESVSKQITEEVFW
jgi:hypothetical protein